MLNSCKATLKKTSVSGPAGGRNFLSSNFFWGGGGGGVVVGKCCPFLNFLFLQK